MARTGFTGHTRSGITAKERVSILAAVRVFRDVSRDRVLGGLLLEGTGWIRLSVRAALWSTAVYGITSVFFAVSHNYLIAAPLLVIGGIANLAALSITQTVTQLRAPDDKKGQVIGVYGVGANGMRIGSGLTVELFGAAVGLRPALGWSSAALCACVGFLAVYLALAARRSPAPESAARAQGAEMPRSLRSP